ncbi:hypothetical protein CDAR_408841 [Caerostris darwini]|uniref:Uncharacterized protein n=1 Tax=Caerostris darwini TaxID=1538125 RepID=A0AAV4PJ93_9ARAC|nr:hypothetical protein CDAR_408841 [Caerostris darwini]
MSRYRSTDRRQHVKELNRIRCDGKKRSLYLAFIMGAQNRQESIKRGVRGLPDERKRIELNLNVELQLRRKNFFFFNFQALCAWSSSLKWNIGFLFLLVSFEKGIIGVMRVGLLSHDNL